MSKDPAFQHGGRDSQGLKSRCSVEKCFGRIKIVRAGWNKSKCWVFQNKMKQASKVTIYTLHPAASHTYRVKYYLVTLIMQMPLFCTDSCVITSKLKVKVYLFVTSSLHCTEVTVKIPLSPHSCACSGTLREDLIWPIHPTGLEN